MTGITGLANGVEVSAANAAGASPLEGGPAPDRQGDTVGSSPNSVLNSLNPADGAVVATLDADDVSSVRAKVARGRQTQPWWAGQEPSARAAALGAWRRHIWARHAELADLIHAENGKPIDDAIIEIALTVEHLQWAETHAKKALASRKLNPGALFANHSARVEYVPLGVVGVISPWNYPLYAPNSGVSAALVAGNTVVLKPSEYTPAVARWYVDAFARANPQLPPGILQIVVGDGAIGAEVTRAGVDKIVFTGSTATGRRIMAQAAETLTPVLLECGGKDPVIVAADADPAAAARAVAWGAFTNGGQTCVGVERVYVLREVRDRFIDALLHELKGIRPGAGRGAAYGAMTMPSQVDVVRRHVEAAGAAGGTFLVGGPESVGERFIEPIVVLDADEDSACVREETFGPMVTIKTVDTLDEAVALANDSDYALSASVFSRRSGDAIAARLRAGQVSINTVIAFAGMGSAPMGGVGGSGFGRVHGVDGLHEFVRPRSTVKQDFGVPGFDLITLRRASHVLPLMKRVLAKRHS
ncbi:aldehyde dehydrogenase [Knoellia sinensis KCTC 19936]|uniref:Aldehyde dehydrogenase n=1 Tax=Knoellia sinensis KCTC 19936 TaxID=1385520 RepID=A0A0A0J5S2_9MICO|nr:aldehyde dehydrogenase family protein [Knoellia sinensis]KGN32109.1 aldehyde dehydrogenase [Knoellia sinensis KCTC 19936]